MAILQPGEQPLWFYFSQEGPVYIETIEDITFTFAFVPWPYIKHAGFFHETENYIIMVINRDGFLRIAPNNDSESELAIYRFSGGEYWHRYSTGGFVYYDNEPTALLYNDERFLTSDTPLPVLRTWSFNMNSNEPFTTNIPALQFYPPQDGWDIDTLRFADDGYYYYRAARRSGVSPVVRMFRTQDLTKAGDEISIETFYNSFPRYEEISNPVLPILPQGFVYTNIGRVGDAIIASWEEQEDFSIAAAGFVVLKY